MVKIVTEIPESVSLHDALLNSPGHLEGALKAKGSVLCSGNLPLFNGVHP
jgi:hypothetical protein